MTVIRDINVFEQYVNNAKQLLGNKVYGKIKDNIAKEREKLYSHAEQIAEPEVKYGTSSDSLKIKAIQSIMNTDDNNVLQSIISYIDTFS